MFISNVSIIPSNQGTSHGSTSGVQLFAFHWDLTPSTIELSLFSQCSVTRRVPGRNSVSILFRLLSTNDILCTPGPSLKGLVEAFQEFIGNVKQVLSLIYSIFLKKILEIGILICIFYR